MIGAEELVVPVALSIVVGAVLIYSMRRHFDLKREKLLAETAMRKLEMEKGFPPGTYSRYRASSPSGDRKWQKSKEGTDAAEREALEKGIEDLKARMADIDTIMKTEGEGK